MLTRKAVEELLVAMANWRNSLIKALALAWLEAHPVCPACDGRGIAVDYGIAPDETCSPCRGLGYCDKAAPDQIIKDQIKVDTRMKALLECAGALCGPCSEGDRPENRIEFSFRRSHIRIFDSRTTLETTEQGEGMKRTALLLAISWAGGTAAGVLVSDGLAQEWTQDQYAQYCADVRRTSGITACTLPPGVTIKVSIEEQLAALKAQVAMLVAEVARLRGLLEKK